MLGASQVFGVVLDESPFYSEAGGQVADTGTLSLPCGAVFVVQDVQSFGGYVMHIGTLAEGSSSWTVSEDIGKGAYASTLLVYAIFFKMKKSFPFFLALTFP